MVLIGAAAERFLIRFRWGACASAVEIHGRAALLASVVAPVPAILSALGRHIIE